MGFLADIQMPPNYNTLDSCYVYIKMFNVKKYGKFYLITITYNIFLDYQDRLDEKIAIYEKSHVLSIDSIPESNMLGFLYNQLKKVFEDPRDL